MIDATRHARTQLTHGAPEARYGHHLRSRSERLRARPEDFEMIELSHTALELVQAKWKLDLLCLLAGGIRRHSRLFDNLPGVSKKVLTSTLRSMQRDGLVTRHVYAEVPVRVEYALSPLGWSLTEVMMALYEWAAVHAGEVEAARALSRVESPADACGIRRPLFTVHSAGVPPWPSPETDRAAATPVRRDG